MSLSNNADPNELDTVLYRPRGIKARFFSKSSFTPIMSRERQLKVLDIIGFPDLKFSIIEIDVRAERDGSMQCHEKALFEAYKWLASHRYSKNGLINEGDTVDIPREKALKSYIFIVEELNAPLQGNENSTYKTSGPWVREDLANGHTREILVLGGLTIYLHTNGSFFKSVFKPEVSPGIMTNWFHKLKAQRLPGLSGRIDDVDQFMQNIPVIEFGKAVFAHPKMLLPLLSFKQKVNLIIRSALAKGLNNRVKQLGVKYALDDASHIFNELSNSFPEIRGLVVSMGFEHGERIDTHAQRRKLINQHKFKSGPLSLIKIYHNLTNGTIDGEPIRGFYPVTGASLEHAILPAGLVDSFSIPRQIGIFNDQILQILRGRNAFGTPSGSVVASCFYYYTSED